MGSLIDVSEILADDVGIVRAGVCGEDAEEIIGCDNLAATLCKVILKEGEEGFVPDARAEFVEEVRPLEICRIGVGTKPLSIIDGDVHKALRVVKINSVRPPPVNEVGVDVFVIDAFRVGA